MGVQVLTPPWPTLELALRVEAEEVVEAEAGH